MSTTQCDGKCCTVSALGSRPSSSVRPSRHRVEPAVIWPGSCLDNVLTRPYRKSPMSSYYRVLGVSRYADLSEIRRAYWSLAKRVRQESQINEIRRAYDTLSDVARRTVYDARQASARKPPAERPHAPQTDLLADDGALDFPSMATMANIVPRMRAAFFGGQVEVGAVHTTRVELTPQEAVEGVQVPLDLPVRPFCPMCGGRGEIWKEPCGLCAGTGSGQLSCGLRLSVPPGVRHGACLRFSVTPPFSAETQIELRIAIP